MCTYIGGKHAFSKKRKGGSTFFYFFSKFCRGCKIAADQTRKSVTKWPNLRLRRQIFCRRNTPCDLESFSSPIANVSYQWFTIILEGITVRAGSSQPEALDQNGRTS